MNDLSNADMNPWNERYGAAGCYYGAEPNDFLRDHCGEIRRGGDVLCLAEGEGRNAIFLAAQGYAVVAVDQSAFGFRKAERPAALKGVPCVLKEAVSPMHSTPKLRHLDGAKSSTVRSKYRQQFLNKYGSG